MAELKQLKDLDASEYLKEDFDAKGESLDTATDASQNQK